MHSVTLKELMGIIIIETAYVVKLVPLSVASYGNLRLHSFTSCILRSASKQYVFVYQRQ